MFSYSYLRLLLFHNDFSPDDEQPEHRVLAQEI